MSAAAGIPKTTGWARAALAVASIGGACLLGSWVSPRAQAPTWPIPARVAEQSALSVEAHTPAAVLSEFETSYNPKHISIERLRGLQIAATAIAGYVLQPGAVFDWNEVLGARVSKPLVDAELADGMGGGLCQLASTLHAAAFFAGLPILQRAPQPRPSFYIKLGLEASLDRGRDLTFKNDRAQAIQITLRVQDGAVRASLRSAASDRRVSFIRHIDEFLPFEEFTDYDPVLPSGLRLLNRRGIPGFKVRRERVIRDDSGHELARERSEDRYPPTAQLWRIGTGPEPPAGFVRPPNDPRPEYIADETLEMTRGEHGAFAVERDAGRSGSYGWTEREGLLVHKP